MGGDEVWACAVPLLEELLLDEDEEEEEEDWPEEEEDWPEPVLRVLLAAACLPAGCLRFVALLAVMSSESSGSLSSDSVGEDVAALLGMV